MQTPRPCPGSTDVDVLDAARAIVARSAAAMLHARRRDDQRAAPQRVTPPPQPDR